jgi:hypothetical protein
MQKAETARGAALVAPAAKRNGVVLQFPVLRHNETLKFYEILATEHAQPAARAWCVGTDVDANGVIRPVHSLRTSTHKSRETQEEAVRRWLQGPQAQTCRYVRVTAQIMRSVSTSGEDYAFDDHVVYERNCVL